MVKKVKPIDTDYLTEHHDLYDVPQFNENDRDYFFTLNESELYELEQLRVIQIKRISFYYWDILKRSQLR